MAGFEGDHTDRHNEKVFLIPARLQKSFIHFVQALCSGNLYCSTKTPASPLLSCSPCCMAEVEVESPTMGLLGRVRQVNQACQIRYRILDPEDNVVLLIHGPCQCHSKCIGQSVNFDVSSRTLATIDLLGQHRSKYCPSDYYSLNGLNNPVYIDSFWAHKLGHLRCGIQQRSVNQSILKLKPPNLVIAL